MFQDIKKVLSQTVKDLGLKKGIESGKALTCWEEVVGEKIADHAQALKIKKDILFVTTTSSTWAQELSLMKKDLIKKINERIEQDKIHKIRFLPRGIKPKGKDDFGDL
jgi:predicted nucleic acid-binding Zn ribbon protein